MVGCGDDGDDGSGGDQTSAASTGATLGGTETLGTTSTSGLTDTSSSSAGDTSTADDDGSSSGDTGSSGDASSGGEASSSAGETDASGGTCEPGEAVCDGDVARVCDSSGSAWNELECSNGCNDGACEPLSLESGWSVHQYALLNDSIATPAQYTFEEDGLIATQTANPMASVYLYEIALPESIVIRGRFSVQTTSDDDIIGFVFGWQDPEHYYLLDWKQTEQDDGTCGLAEEGASLKVVASDEEIDDCADFWTTAGTDRVTPVVPVSENPDGWEDEAVYDFHLVFRPGDIRIEIRQGDDVVVSLTSDDETYTSGNFGFFNYSQEAVRYEFFAISPID